MPIYSEDPTGTFSFFHKGSIPMNLLMPTEKGWRFPSRFPPLSSWAPHVKQLEITHWTAPHAPKTPQIKRNPSLGPELMVYDIWAGYERTKGISCLWIGSRESEDQPVQYLCVDQALARIVYENMENLQSFV